MKILVTGTAGFIGFCLARRLLADGHEVVGLDNFNDYYSVQLKEDRHAILDATADFTGMRGDLCDRALLEQLFREHDFGVVCHLAAQAGVRHSLTHPHAYQKWNLEGFLNVLECCRHSNLPRLVYASSSSVYGKNQKLPWSEDDPIDHPVSLYAATKRANELMAQTYTNLYGFQTVGLRFFTVYGPWSRPDMAMWLFVASLFRGDQIPVFNHGDMLRDFTYIDDIVEGVRALLFAKNLDAYEILNIGNHTPEKLLTMIDILAGCVGVKPNIKLLPMQPGDVKATFATVDRIRDKVGFTPTTTIEDGIPRFVEWYREYHGIG